MALLVVDQHFIDILGRQVGSDSESRSRGQHLLNLLLEYRHIDLGTQPRLDARCGEVATRQLRSQLSNDHYRPPSVKPLPMTLIVEWRTEMVAQRHGTNLLRPHPAKEGM